MICYYIVLNKNTLKHESWHRKFSFTDLTRLVYPYSLSRTTSAKISKVLQIRGKINCALNTFAWNKQTFRQTSRNVIDRTTGNRSTHFFDELLSFIWTGTLGSVKRKWPSTSLNLHGYPTYFPTPDRKDRTTTRKVLFGSFQFSEHLN